MVSASGTDAYAGGLAGVLHAGRVDSFYAGIFANWNWNVDGESGNDAPWDFGAWMKYPMLKWNGMSLSMQGSLAMGMESMNRNYPVGGERAGVCLVNGPRLRGDVGSRPGWQWQRSSDGAAWTDIAEDGAPTFHYTPVAGDVGYYLRFCVRIFAKTQAAPTP